MARVKITDLLEARSQLDDLLSRSRKLVETLDKSLSQAGLLSQQVDEKLLAADTANKELISAKSGALAKADEIQVQLNRTSSLSQKIEAFSAKITKLDQGVNTKSTELNDLINRSSELKSEIESLLPGATSAGLSVAFKERKLSYAEPIKFWSRAFMVSIGLLIFFAVFNPLTFSFERVTEANVFSYIISKLPFLGPLIWFAIYSSHRHGQSLRLEEEYAHKEAVSKSFEGYKKQLLEIESSEKDTKATEQLITRTLDSITLNPGRIYDKKRESTSPIDAIRDMLPSKSSPEA